MHEFRHMRTPHTHKLPMKKAFIVSNAGFFRMCDLNKMATTPLQGIKPECKSSHLIESRKMN